MQRLTDMSTSELIQFAGQHSASIKEVGIYSELMKELTTRLGANTAAVTQALKERDEARLELSSAQLTISQISEVLGISSSVSISEQVKQLKSENHLLGVDVELRDSVISTLKSELASQNQQVVNLAVENAGLKSLESLNREAFEDLFTQCCSNPVTNAWGKPVDFTLVNKAREHSSVKTPSTEAFLTNIQAQGVKKFAANEREWAAHWEKHGVTDGSVSRCLIVAQDAEKFATQLREGTCK